MARSLLFNSFIKFEIKSINYRNIFGLNQSKQTNSGILCQNFGRNNSFSKCFFKNSLFLIISIFGSKFVINRVKQNEDFYQMNDNFCQSIKNLQLIEFWSKIGLRRSQMLFKRDENDANEDQNQWPPSKRFNFIADVTEKVSSALVFLDVEAKHPFFNTSVSVSNGSGFVVDSSGLILTNAHVVGNSSKVSVKLFDGRAVSGRVEYVDHRLDLATVRIDVKEKLPFIRLGDSQKSRTGEWVIALGSPFTLSNTITVGVISSVNRKSRELGINENEIDYIQTDAIINIGNSGGPLVNLDGEAIGINAMKVAAGISFAIPSNYAKEFLERANSFRQKTPKDRIEEKTSKKNRFIGISMLTLTPEIIRQLRTKDENFPKDVENGIFVWSVVMGSPAHLEGLKPGDIITRINGKTANSVNQIFESMEENQTLSLTVRRQGRDANIVVRPQLIDG